MSHWLVRLSLALLGLACLPLVLVAEPIKPSREWRGSVEDLALMKQMPKSGVITTAKDLTALWKAWKVEGKVPAVDFSKELVGVATSRGSRLNLSASLDKKGDLRLLGFGTRDLRPGFRYVIGTFPKAGVKTVNGKALE